MVNSSELASPTARLTCDRARLWPVCTNLDLAQTWAGPKPKLGQGNVVWEDHSKKFGSALLRGRGLPPRPATRHLHRRLEVHGCLVIQVHGRLVIIDGGGGWCIEEESGRGVQTTTLPDSGPHLGVAQPSAPSRACRGMLLCAAAASAAPNWQWGVAAADRLLFRTRQVVHVRGDPTRCLTPPGGE